MQRDDNRMLDHNTTYTEEQAAKRGKLSNTGETLTTVDIPTSDVVKEWETVNDKAVTVRRGKNLFTLGFDIPDDENVIYDGAENDRIAAYQSDMAVNGNKITGTILPFMPQGDFDVSKSYYLIFKIDAEGADSVNLYIKGEEYNIDPFTTLIDNVLAFNIDSVSGSNPHTEDETCRLKDLVVTVVKNGAEETKTYDISGLILKADEQVS